MDTNRFQKDKEIDPNRLDLECVLQPERFFYWAQAAVEASSEVDKAKLKLDVTQAKLEMECRQKPEDFGIAKATENAITAGVKSSEKYQEAWNDYIEARKESKLLDAAVTAMEQKKRMLEVLITLHGQQYFAGPSVPRDLVADWKEHRKGIETNVNEQQKARTRKRGQSK